MQLTDYADFEQPTRGYRLELPAGATSASVPYTYTADDVYDPVSAALQVTLLAEKDAVTADFDGTLLVEEDDPPPVLTVDANRVTAAEGSALTWTFRLSEPLANGAFWSIQFLPAAGRFPELDSDDVPASFLENFGIVPPDPAVPLSELGLFLDIEFAPGVDTRDPVAADRRRRRRGAGRRRRAGARRVRGSRRAGADRVDRRGSRRLAAVADEPCRLAHDRRRSIECGGDLILVPRYRRAIAAVQVVPDARQVGAAIARLRRDQQVADERPRVLAGRLDQRALDGHQPGVDLARALRRERCLREPPFEFRRRRLPSAPQPRARPQA